MQSIIWAMDTQNDSLKNLMATIRSYAYTFGSDNELNIKCEFPILENEILVKGQIRHHIFLIVKEVLNNILKHSEADKVNILMNMEQNKLQLKIIENGKGFDVDVIKSSGRGLKSMRKRVDLIGVHFGAGASVFLRCIFVL